MDNQYNQSEVAYGNGPKEVNHKRGMHDGNKQFGKHKMPQDSKPATKGYVKEIMEKHVKIMHSRHGRHKEHR